MNCDLCESPRAYYRVNMLDVCAKCVLDALDVPEFSLKPLPIEPMEFAGEQ